MTGLVDDYALNLIARRRGTIPNIACHVIGRQRHE